MSRCKLEEFITYEQPAKYIVDSDQYDDSFDIPVLTAGKSFILGYTDETNNIFDNLPVIIFDDFTTSVQFVDFPFKVKSSAMKLLKNTEQADIKYCYYLLKFLQHTPENHKRQWLSATSQNIVELPTIEEQKNIVRKLDKILEVIDNQNKQLELLDEAIKARFVEMFGTLHDNENRFNIVTIEEVCSIIKDGTHQTPHYTEDKINGYKFLSSKDVMSQKINWENIKYIPKDLHEKLYASIQPQRNDILMSKNGVNYGVAAVNDTDEVFDIYVSLALLRPKQLIDPVFFRCVINNIETKRQFDMSIKGIGVPNLHLGEIKKTKIILPPMVLQKQFVTFVKQIDKSRLLSNHLLFLIKSISSNH